MVRIDPYTSCGYAIELLALSQYHRQFRLKSYLEREVFPALRAEQVRFYCADDGRPTAMVSWAWLSEPVEHEVHRTGRALSANEWRCGDRLFFNDCITPFGNVREVLRDMTHNVFPENAATSLRRNQDGSVRRINHWTGVNLRTRAQGVVA
ncbi:toxin-activating lysine-acyltransferase [Actibacterium sp. 188UL27-1]|uniref:toxin-activating lysine-acyltransferase n=1 Tax=Actibacterium sp. 188UL27-1 TaxID=2786961 RepID=UPI001956F4A3|nr:toxin-activating lysine-acyltransferase [Actibacterium sp. 188UL27-1]MBM7068644.1 toxin-activating lysine-acyltransferase [Actibacterium sp. 188UL27-1]